MSSLQALCCFQSVKKQIIKHVEYSHFFCLMYNKITIIRFGFCDTQNNQGLGKGYQPDSLWLLFLFFLSAEEGEEGEEDSPLSYDKLIMPGIKFKVFFRHIHPVSNKAQSRNCLCACQLMSSKFCILE